MTARRLALAVAALWALQVLGGVPAAADEVPAPVEVTAADLIADGEGVSGRAVVVRGELVGDFGRRGDGTVWAQLNGDAYAATPVPAGGSLSGAYVGFGVRFPPASWAGLADPGGYRVRGPVVAVTGVWRFHDPERSGESYLDASGVVLLAPAEAIEAGGPRWLPLGLGLGFFVAAAATALIVRRRRG